MSTYVPPPTPLKEGTLNELGLTGSTAPPWFVEALEAYGLAVLTSGDGGNCEAYYVELDWYDKQHCFYQLCHEANLKWGGEEDNWVIEVSELDLPYLGKVLLLNYAGTNRRYGP